MEYLRMQRTIYKEESGEKVQSSGDGKHAIWVREVPDCIFLNTKGALADRAVRQDRVIVLCHTPGLE